MLNKEALSNILNSVSDSKRPVGSLVVDGSSSPGSGVRVVGSGLFNDLVGGIGEEPVARLSALDKDEINFGVSDATAGWPGVPVSLDGT